MSKSKIFTFIGLILILTVSIVLAYKYTSVNPQPVVDMRGTQVAEDIEDDFEITDSTDVNDGTISAISEGRSLDVIAQESEGVINTPNVSNKEVSDNLQKSGVLDSNESSISEVIFTGIAFKPGVLTIKQGDIVNFKNESTNTLFIIGKDNWGNSIGVEEGKTFSQEFDIKGEYKYWVRDKEDISGTIIVE